MTRVWEEHERFAPDKRKDCPIPQWYGKAIRYGGYELDESLKKAGDLETIDSNDSRQDDQELPRPISRMVRRSRESDHFLLHYIRYDRLHDRVRNR